MSIRALIGGLRAFGPVAAVLLLSAPAFSQMSLPGKFDVSEQGSATYTVPISIPPGSAGLQPKLDLVYDSRGGNGLLGVGWSLAGLPAITRCGRTLVQDGAVGGVAFDANDRFCLDGQRLVATTGTYGADGTVYGTERESFSKVVSYGSAGSGPAWFKVWTKAGLILEFGNTADSRIEAVGKSSARVWALNKTSDTKGNYFSVSYTEDTTNGEYRPSRIDYTGNASAGVSPYASVRFVYETRTDLEFAYLAGSQIKPTQRLTKIQTYQAENLVSDYRLTYEYSPLNARSRITAVKICDASGTCLPQTSFTWQGEVQALNSSNVIADGSQYTNCSAGIVGNGDWNGDGRGDFICRNGATEYVVLSSPTAVFAESIGTLSASPVTYRKLIVGDWNGDGRSDFLAHYPAGSTNVAVYLTASTGTSFSQTAYAPGTWADYEISVGDFNADGRSDLFLKARVASVASKIMLSDGAGNFTDAGYSSATGWDTKKVTLGDFDGDGLTDLLIYPTTGDATVMLTRWSGSTLSFSEFTVAHGGHSSQTFEAADLNGDGLMDLFQRSYTGAARVLISDGTGSFVSYSPTVNYMGVLGDVTGDNAVDLVNLNQTSTYHSGGCNFDGSHCPPEVFNNTYTYSSRKLFADRLVSRDMFSYSLLGNHSAPPNTYFAQIDFSGDGVNDYFHSWTTTTAVSQCCNYEGWPYTEYVTNYHHAYYGSLNAPEVIKEVTTGSGAVTKIAYDRLNTATVAGFYSKDTGGTACAYPCVDVQGPIYVVSEVKTSNGVGGEYRSTYRYVGAKAHAQGRGFLGFRQLVARDEQTGIEQTSTYLQDYPYTGLLATREKKRAATAGAAGPQLNLSTNSYAADTLSVANGGGQRRFVKLTQSVEQSWELPASGTSNGTTMPSVTTGYTYDAYGNATEVSVGTGDGHSKTTTNTYTNDVTNWFLGRLTRAVVTSTTP